MSFSRKIFTHSLFLYTFFVINVFFTIKRPTGTKFCTTIAPNPAEFAAVLLYAPGDSASGVTYARQIAPSSFRLPRVLCLRLWVLAGPPPTSFVPCLYVSSFFQSNATSNSPSCTVADRKRPTSATTRAGLCTTGRIPERNQSFSQTSHTILQHPRGRTFLYPIRGLENLGICTMPYENCTIPVTPASVVTFAFFRIRHTVG